MNYFQKSSFYSRSTIDTAIDASILEQTKLYQIVCREFCVLKIINHMYNDILSCASKHSQQFDQELLYIEALYIDGLMSNKSKFSRVKYIIDKVKVNQAHMLQWGIPPLSNITLKKKLFNSLRLTLFRNTRFYQER